MNTPDNLIPARDKWEFDTAVTDVFDAMLENSIPSYREMRKWTDMLAKRVLERVDVNDVARVTDLGASRGNAVEALVDEFPKAHFNLIEVSEPMRKVLEEKFRYRDYLFVYDRDLRYPKGREILGIHYNSLVLAVLTLMFIPIEYRMQCVQDIYNSIKQGGAFLLVEKTLGDSAHGDNLLTTEYYQFKADNGYTEEAILRKKLSLEGVLVPLSAKHTEQMLKDAGFKTVQRYYQALNFVGWIAIK